MNKKIAGFGVGTSSIIMIFVVLCLTIFSLLSYSSSCNSLKFANKAKEYAQLSSEAELKANILLAEIDTYLFSASEITDYNNAISEISNLDGVNVSKMSDYYFLNYEFAITSNTILQVELKLPLTPSKQRYKITKWRTYTPSHNYNNGENIWDGENF